MIVFGTRMYGRVDQMPEGYIATHFFHIWFVPLFPIKSILVTDDSNDRNVRGIPMGWSGKSILAAYVRTAGVLGTLVCLGIAAVLALGLLDSGMTHPFQEFDYYSQSWVIDWTTLLGLPIATFSAIVSALTVWGSYKLLGHASEARRRTLLARVTGAR